MSGYGLSNLSRLEKIGEGTYGVVYKCLDRKSGQLKALKCIKLEHTEQGVPSTSLREIALLRELKHPNIVDLEHVVLDDGRLYLLFEYLSLDLRRYLDLNYKNTGLPPDTVKSFMYQMLQGLCYCHLRRVIHRDLKPQNVLVDVDRGVVKLADFGLARSFGYPLRALSHDVVTLWYRPPEVLLEIATGDPPFRGDSEIDQLFHVFQVKGVPTEETWPGVGKLPHYNPALFPSWPTDRLCSQEVIRRALDADGLDLLAALLLHHPQSRMSAQQALLHPYFANLDKNSLPAVGEEYVGMPTERIPRNLAEAFRSLVNIGESDPESDDEEWMKEMEEVINAMPEMVPSTMLLGASTYQVSAAREKFAKEASGKSGIEKQEGASAAEKRVTGSSSENRNVN